MLPNGILSYLPTSQQSTKEMVYLITLINTLYHLKYQKLFCILYGDFSKIISQMTCDLECNYNHYQDKGYQDGGDLKTICLLKYYPHIWE